MFVCNMLEHDYPLGIITPVSRNRIWYMGEFLESFIWLAMDHCKDNFRNNNLILKPNYFISFLIIRDIHQKEN